MALDKANIVEQLSNATVIEIADLVKELETKWGVSAAAPVAVAAAAPGTGAAAAAAAPAKDTFDAANRVLGFDLASLCFTGPQERLDQTDISQPAIYVTSVASFRAAKEASAIDPAQVSLSSPSARSE